MLDSVLDSLSNIIKISDFIKVSVNSGMGFVLGTYSYFNENKLFLIK